MNRIDLVAELVRRASIDRNRADLAVRCIFDVMSAALERYEGIEVRGFGSFTVREYEPYIGRNPRTGNDVPVESKRLPHFRPGKEIRALLNGARSADIRSADRCPPVRPSDDFRLLQDSPTRTVG